MGCGTPLTHIFAPMCRRRRRLKRFVGKILKMATKISCLQQPRRRGAFQAPMLDIEEEGMASTEQK